MFKTTTTALAFGLTANVALAAVHSLGQGGQCLQVSGGASAGAAVTLGSCNANNAQRGTTGQQWVISPGNNQGVQLFGSSLCLDAQDDTPGAVVIADCSGSGSQTWYLTGDNRIAITGGSQCLQASGTNAETQDCAPGVAGQAWTPTFLFDENEASSSANASSTTNSTGAGGVVGGATGSAASAASGVSASLTSAASGVGASATSALSGAASGASSLASGATGALGSATSGAGSIAGQATSGAASVGGQVTSGAGSAAGAATSAGASAVSAASSAIGSAAGGGGGNAASPRMSWSPVAAVLSVALGGAWVLVA